MIHSIPFSTVRKSVSYIWQRATRILFLPEIAEDEDADAGDIGHMPGMMRHRAANKGDTLQCGQGCWQNPIMASDRPHMPIIAVTMAIRIMGTVALIMRSCGADTKM